MGALGTTPLKRWAILTMLLTAVAGFAAEEPLVERRTDNPAQGVASAWHEGADGFTAALEEALAEKRPLAVYFYTDWCHYCRQFESELLYRADVEDGLGFLTRVRINPESGAGEASIAQRYGVFSYPSFFVHPGPGREAVRVTGRVQRDGLWGFQTPSEFLETLRQTAAE